MRTLDKLHKKNLRLAAEDEIYDQYDLHDHKNHRNRYNHHEHQARSHRYRGKRHYRQAANEVFKCKHCRRFIGPLPCGGHHRNHCPFCLHSRHVDEQSSGDRLSVCGSTMAPIGTFQRHKGEHVVIHRCLGCGFERFNRIAADDDFDLVLSLPQLPPRNRHDLKAQRLGIIIEA